MCELYLAGFTCSKSYVARFAAGSIVRLQGEVDAFIQKFLELSRTLGVTLMLHRTLSAASPILSDKNDITVLLA
jgi:hypothetical protein